MGEPRAVLRVAAIGLFSSQFAILDLVTRGVTQRPEGTMLTLVGSVATMAALAWIARSWPARVVLALLTGAVLFVQAALSTVYRPLDLQVLSAGLAAWSEVGPVVRAARTTLAVGVVVTALIELGLLALVHQRVPEPASRRAALLALVCLIVGPELELRTPEYQAASALLVIGRPAEARLAAHGAPVPIIESSRPELPSVLLVLTESVRAIDYCSAPVETCREAPEVNALLPDRVALSELRALGSYSAVSAQVIISGQAQLGTKQQIADQETVFDFVRATRRRDERVHVAYYGNHWRRGIFERENITDVFDRFHSADDLPDAENELERRDGHLVDLFVDEVAAVPRASFTVLHLYATHAPYFFDDEHPAIASYTHSSGWENMPQLHNAYLNSIIEQDREIARALRAFIDTRAGHPWVILMTSDHGEAFGEHHAIHHGQNLYDEQIHVPGFIAASPGAIADASLATLRERAGGPTSHADLLPTILDVFGVWQSPALEPYRRRLIGSSLLGARLASPRALPITSCTESLKCALSTWGVLGETKAIVAQPWDRTWNCVLLDDKATELSNDEPDCERLIDASRGYFPRLPNGKPND